jgi:hypothetical protein
MGDEVLVTSAEIARMAGIDRAAVSNWRRRYEDFPKPVAGTASSPQFSLEQVESWLRGRKREVRLSPELRTWQRLRSLGGDLRLTEVLTAAGWFLCYLRSGDWPRWAQADDKSLETALPAEVRRLTAVGGKFPDKLPPGVAPLLRDVADLAAEKGEGALFEAFVAQFLAAFQRSYTATPPVLASLMAKLAGPDASVCLDPACGTGSLLLTCAQEAGSTRLLGQELDPDLAALAGVRLSLAGYEADVRGNDALRADGFRGTLVDAVVCNPPFNVRDWGHEELVADSRWEYGLPPVAESELTWVQHALSHVKPGGTVVMLMPVAAANRRSGRRIRAALLRKGALRAVIGIPSTMASAAGIPGHLWVLRKPHPAERPGGSVLIAQLSLEPTPDELDALVASWRLHRTDPEAEALLGQKVQILDLLDDETDVTPSRYLETGQTTPHEALSMAAGLKQRLKEISDLLPTDVTVPRPDGFTLTTVADLVNAGVLQVVRPGRGEELWAESGDLLVSAAGERYEVRVVGEPVRVAAPVQILSVDPDHVDAHFVAGFLRSAHNRLPAEGSTSSVRKDVRRAIVPRPPEIEEQRAYAAIFRRVEKLRVLLDEASDAGLALALALVDMTSNGGLPEMRSNGDRRPHVT